MAIIKGGGAADTLNGTSGDDSIYGAGGNDEIVGGDGNDQLDGGDGNDYLDGGNGNDTLDGAAGADTLDGGAGDDIYYVGNSHQFILDSAGNDTAYVSASFVKVPSSIEKVVYQNGARALPYWVDALLPDEAAGLSFSDFLGPPKTYYYAFPSTLPAYDSSAANAKGWSALTAVQQQRAKDALAYISSVVDLTFVQTSNPATLNTIAFANNTQTDSSGYAQYPNQTEFEGSDVFLDNSSASPYNASLQDETYGALVLIHEIGHALGLEHPGNYNAGGGGADAPFLSAVEDKTTWTVMSYTSSSAQYRLQYSPLDIATLQYLYGPSKTSRTGNDTYSISTVDPNFIWDGAGTDTISAASCNQGCTIYLTPGYWGHVGAGPATSITAAGQITVNFGTTIESLTGSAYGDSLYGNSVDNTIDGGAGNDLIEGGGGNDRLTGGAGVDTAVFTGPRTSYKVSIDRVRHTVTVADQQGGRDGADSLSDVETLQFGTQTFAIYNNARTATPKYGVSNAFLFDAAYYLLSNPTLTGVTLDTAAQNYLTTGAKAGLAPNDWFDPTYYANRWADLKGAGLDAATLFQHYNLYGVWEGRSAGTRFDKFDGTRYLTNNPDVAAYVDVAIADFLGSRTNGALAHYIIYGAAEGRVAYDTGGNALETVLVIGASTTA